jgi:2-oxoisovalerate dehydrogenase E1 component beta subunit
MSLSRPALTLVHSLGLSRLLSAHTCRLRRRPYSSTASSPSARLNKPTDFNTTPLVHHTASSALSNPELSQSLRTSSKTNRRTFQQTINDTLRQAMTADESVIVFGEDIGFGGVFRVSMDLLDDFSDSRVFNTPLTEQGIVGFAIGAAAQGMRPVAEIQFADYVFPAFDQIVNEAAKMRYRAGTTSMHCGSMVIRMPCGAIGHGAM